MGHMGLIFSPIHPYTYTSTPKETESGPWAPDPPQPNPRKQPPHNYLPEHTGQAPTHLGKLGNAPGPVRCRPTVGSPSGPGPSPLHGPQRAQFQSPRRRLGRAGERLVFRRLAEGPLSGAGVFVQICLLQHSCIHSFIQPTNKATGYLLGAYQSWAHDRDERPILPASAMSVLGEQGGKLDNKP